ncbi:MAG: putative ABC transporter permease [Ruthenibacterium sp.]
MLGLTLYEIFWYFVIYSFLGWCLEVCFCTIDTGELVNRGFLNGPICPIYGFGMLAVLFALLPLRNKLLLLFLGAILVTSLIELIGGFLLKKLFHTSWWDYSDAPFNLGGYICLKFSLAWGIAGVAAVRVIHPLVAKLVHTVPRVVGTILIPVVVALGLCDLIVTVLAITKMNRTLGIISEVAKGLRTGSDALSKNLGETSLAADEKLSAAKQSVSEKLSAVLEEGGERREEKRARRKSVKSRVSSRLLRAFPHMKHSTDNEALTALREWHEKHTHSDKNK